MKKLLGSTLALAMLFPYSQANAELLKNFKLSGQLDVQTQASRNLRDFVSRQSKTLTQAQLGTIVTPVVPGAAPTAAIPTFNDRVNDAQTRVLLHLDWDMLDDVHAKITLRKNDRTYGTQGNRNLTSQAGATGDNAQSITRTATNGDLLNSIFIDQAFVKIGKMMGAVDATFGRQFYGTPGDLVIYYGPSDKALYGLPSTAIDAVRADWMGENLWVTGIAGKQAGTLINTVVAVPTTINPQFDNIDIRGITAGYKVMDGLTVDAHVYNRVAHGRGALGSDSLSGKNDNLYVYGATGKWEGSGFNVSVEFEKNNGENRNPEDATGIPAAFTASNNNAGCPGTATGSYANNPFWCYGAATAVSNNSAAAYTGYAWKVDASYKADVEGIATFTPWTQFAWGTGRGNTSENKNEGFHSINGDYRPGAIYGRFAASGAMTLGSGIPCLPGAEGCNAAVAAGTMTGLYANGISPAGLNNLNNRVIWGAGLKTTPAAVNQLTIAVSWWSFWMQRVTASKNQTFTNGLGIRNGQNAGAGNQAKHLGSELDFDLTWKHSENVTLTAGAAAFQPGTFIKNLIQDQVSNAAVTANVNATHIGNNPAILAYSDLRIKF